MLELNNVLIAVAGLALVLVVWSWLVSQRRQLRRTLAFVFVGEISAFIREFEIHAVIEKLETAVAGKSELGIDFSSFTLPNFIAYEAHATRLSVFGNSMTRQMTYFYSRLASLAADFRALSSQDSLIDRDAHSALVGLLLTESKAELALADDILRGLRRFVSTSQPSSISRA